MGTILVVVAMRCCFTVAVRLGAAAAKVSGMFEAMMPGSMCLN